MAKRFMVMTLGCKANFADGQSLEADLISKGLVSTRVPEEADLFIVNSCTVTDEADRQSKKAIRDLQKKNPDARVVYTGCSAEVDPESALKVPGVSAVLGNQDKAGAGDLILGHFSQDPQKPVILGAVSAYEELRSRHPVDREWPLAEEGAIPAPELPEESSTFRTRAFLKIQEGCDSFCTYCIIPYGRGPARSLSVESVLERVQELVSRGIREVVLTGTNIGEFGVDRSGSFELEEVLEAILTRTKLERLRVGSLDPTEITDGIISLMESHESFCPHFHVSLQHTESRILKLMKRKYSRAEVDAFFSRVARMSRRPFLGMDLITGFPGESEADFAALGESLAAFEWNRLHVFPYSEREGTPATRLPGSVDRSIRKDRARILQAMSLERLTRFYAGHRSQLLSGVLIEGKVRGPDGKREWVSGYTPDYQRVLVPLSAEAGYRNTIVNATANHWVVDRSAGEVSWIGSVNERVEP